MANFQIIDLVFLLLAVILMVRGYMRGFISGLFSWAALVLSIGGAVLFFPQLGALIRTRFMENVRYVPEVISFVGIFIGVSLLVRMIEHVLRDVVAGARLGGLNRFLGSLFGLTEGLALALLVLFILTVQPFFDASSFMVDSIFAQLLLPILRFPLDRNSEEFRTALSIFYLAGFPA
ncbi:MAG: CvpA family protein [Treponema sp.]|nr:CvpA family protein [Treponema sp.]